MAAFGFVFWLLVAHYYTPAQVGIASTLISAMSFISYLSLLGFNTTFIHFLPQSKRRSQEVDTGLILVLLAGLFVAGLYAFFVPFITPKLYMLHEHWYYAVAFIILVAGSAINLVTDSIFIAYRASIYNFFVDGVISSLVQVSLPVLLVGFGAFGIYASAGIAVTVAMIMSIFLLIRRFGYVPQFRINKKTLREVVSYSSLSYAANVLNILPVLLLPLIIINKLGDEAAGFYYLAFMMANLLYSISYALSQSTFAEGSYAQMSTKALARKAASALALVMIPASVLFGLLGPTLLKLFGHTYSLHGHALLLVFALSGPFVAAYIFGCSMLRIYKRVRQIVVVNTVYAGIICSLAYAWAGRGLVWIGLAWLLGNAFSGLLIAALLSFSSLRPSTQPL